MYAILHKAAARGFERITECLIHRYPTLASLQDSNGKTALHVAIEQKNTPVALFICDYMTKEEHLITDIMGYTPLHVACLLGNIAIARVLLVKGSDPLTIGIPFHLKSSKHFFGVYLKRTCNDYVMTPLECVFHGWSVAMNDEANHIFYELFVALIKAAKPTPKHPVIAHLGHTICTKLVNVPAMAVQCLEFLFQRKLLVMESLDASGNTVLMKEVLQRAPVAESSLAVVRILVQFGANAQLTNHYNENALMCAAFHGNDKLLELLLDTVPYAALLSSCQNANSPLHMACLRGYLSTIQLLLSRGASLHVCTKDESPLYFAIRSQKLEVLEFLLHHNAQVNLSAEIKHKRVYFDTSFNILQTTLGSPLTLVLLLTKPQFQERCTDHIIPSHIADRLTLMQHTYMKEKEQAARNSWLNLHRIADLLMNKIIQIDPATKIHLTKEDIVLAARVGFWSIISTYLTHRRMDLSNSSIPEAKMDAIHLAAAAGQPIVVSLLVSNGADPNAKMIHGRNTLVGPLFFAYSRGHHITAAKLHLLGATVITCPKYEKFNYLMQSHLNWWMKIAMLWHWLKRNELKALGNYVNMLHQLQLSKSTSTPVVHISCHRGCLPLLLVYHHADYTFHDVSSSGHTPLTIAIQQQHVNIVEWLITTIPPLLTMRSPRLPLACAAALTKKSLVKGRLISLLLDAVQNELTEERVHRLTCADASGCTALEHAALASDENTIACLLKEIPDSSVTIATIAAALQGPEPHAVLDLLLKSWKCLREANFDYILQLFIMASSYQEWKVVNHLLVQEEASIEPYLTWIRRAASCCLVLHRAAAANQVVIVNSLVTKFSIPPDLIVANIPSRTPMWYAAAHTAWDSFVVLVIALGPTCSILPSLILRGTKDTISHGRCRAFKFPHERLRTRSTMLNGFLWPIVAKEQTDAVRVEGFEICTWKNISAFSIYGSPALHTQRIIHRAAQYWMAQALLYPANEPNDSLLHLAVRARDLKMVVLLIQAGAPINSTNHAGEMPWIAAAKQNDLNSTRIITFVWPLLDLQAKEAVVKATTTSDTLNMATLTYLLTQAIPKETPTTLLNLSGHSYFSSSIRTINITAVNALMEAKVPMDHRIIWQELLNTASKSQQTARVLVETLMSYIPLSLSLEIVANLVLLSAQQQWYNVVLHLLQAFQLPLVRQLQITLAPGTNASVLHYVVDHGQATVLQKLLQQNMAILCDSKGRTPLHKLAFRGDIGLMQLWQRVAHSVWFSNLDAQDNKGDTAFHVAARRGHLSVVEVLQNSNSNAGKIRNVKGWTPILEAAKHNHLPIVMRLFLQQPPSDTLVSTENISIVAIAAEYGAFTIVSWLLATMGLTSSEIQRFLSKDGRNLVHFAASYNAIELLSNTPALKSLINTRDQHGCLPLHYALMLGHLKVVEFLSWHGSDVHSPIQNHITEKQVTISTLISWNPLPGWFGHAIRSNEAIAVPSSEKLMQRVSYTLSQWDITKISLLEASSRIGLTSTVTLILTLLPQLPQLCDGALETRQRIFMQAVLSNHVDIVDRLCLCEVVHPVDKSHYFRDFIEVAIQKSSSRGLEQMTLCLLHHWRNSCYLGTVSAALVTQAEFAFQFATVLQQACIYGRLKLVEYLLQQGGESIIGYRVDEGPALVYAFAFGHKDVVNLLCQYSAEISALDGHFAPSLKLWIEFKEHPLLQNEWYERGSESKGNKPKRHPFAGPIEVYACDDERLPREYLELAFRR
ncbi:hypothetical protein THRCLA_04131 [Thraustotheca clavata]|uniref:Uncharacterized protein n=1 Tax=Thraustotheca clavata TaxID=74557 RepID=A0A1W0A0K2_9STRA|nr:hypothetical protein THRCLA_04131 [Thraustotheca clavata]